MSMDSKLVKYRKYILDDLLKDTIVDNENDRVYVPFKSSNDVFGITTYNFIKLINNVGTMSWYKDYFDDYLKEKYGAKDDDIVRVWYVYCLKMSQRL